MNRERFERAREAILGADNPTVVLEVIVDGDPLELFETCCERLEARSLLLAPARVHEQSVYRVTAMSALLDPEEDLRPWIVEQVDLSIDTVLRRDDEALHDLRAPHDAVAESKQFLSQVFGFEPEVAFRAAARFNRLASGTRSAYVALMIQRRSLEECVEAGMGTAETLKEWVREAAAIILAEAKAWRFQRGVDELMEGEA